MKRRKNQRKNLVYRLPSCARGRALRLPRPQKKGLSPQPWGQWATIGLMLGCLLPLPWPRRSACKLSSSRPPSRPSSNTPDVMPLLSGQPSINGIF